MCRTARDSPLPLRQSQTGPSQSLSSEALCLAGLRDEARGWGVQPCCVSGSGFCPGAVVPWHAVSETPQAAVGMYIRFPEVGCPQPSAGAPVSGPRAKSHLCPCPTLHTVGALTTSDSSPSHLGSPSHSHNPVVWWGKQARSHIHSLRKHLRVC